MGSSPIRTSTKRSLELKMNFESLIVDIKKLIKALNNKDTEVFITYRGYDLGISKPWLIKCDAKEVHHETHEGAAQMLYDQLMDEMKRKISSTEEQIERYKESLNEIVNKPGLDKKKPVTHEVPRRQETSFS